MSGIETPQLQEPPGEESGSEGDRSVWQFSLRGAFWFLTAAAGAAAVARFKGPGSLVLSTGVFLAWLNARGAVANVQTRRLRPRLFYAAWLLLAASLFLPSARGCNNSVHYGWESASLAAQWEVMAAHELIVKRNLPATDELPEAIGFTARITLINLANLLALLSPLLLWRLQREQGQRLGAMLAVSSIAVWSIPMGDHLLIGCYVWCAGFVVLTLSYRIGWRVFAAMAALAAVFIIASP